MPLHVSRQVCQVKYHLTHGLLSAVQVWPFTESRFANQHIHAAFRGKALPSSLCNPARQVPLLSLLKHITIRHTKEVLQLPEKTVEDVPGALCCVMLCCGMQCCAVLCDNMPCWGVLCYSMASGPQAEDGSSVLTRSTDRNRCRWQRSLFIQGAATTAGATHTSLPADDAAQCCCVACWLLTATVYLNRAERRAYQTALSEAQRQWATGMFNFGNMRLQALALLQPMRRVCSGGRCAYTRQVVYSRAVQQFLSCPGLHDKVTCTCGSCCVAEKHTAAPICPCARTEALADCQLCPALYAGCMAPQK